MAPAAIIPANGMMMSEAIAKDAVISWFRGEFAAANAIIDALCSHISQFEGGRDEYEGVFGAIHRRRMNWIPVLQMQKFFSIADVTLELQKVVEMKKGKGGEEGVKENGEVVVVEEEAKMEAKDEVVKVVEEEEERGGGGEDSPKSGVTYAGSQEEHSAVESTEICSNQEDWEARRAEIKMTKGFIAKESVKGHMVNVVRGLKLYEDILNTTELSKLSDYVNELRVAGQNGELSGGPCDS